MASQLVTVHENLECLLKEKSEALPKDFNQTRFLQNCMTVLMDTKNIEKMDAKSIARTMLKGAFLGLDFFTKECYAIAYGNQLNFQTDYKGEIKLAKKYSINPIKDVYAKLVKEDDVFLEKIQNGQQSVDFQPNSFSDKKIIGAFAVVLYNDGSMIYDTMTHKEIEGIRSKFSKASNSKAWVDTWGEMAKKTVLRRLLKLVQLDFDRSEQDTAFEESSAFDFSKKPIEINPEENINLVSEINKPEEPEEPEAGEVLFK